MLKIFRYVGIPTIIRTDGATLFTSYQFQKFLKDWSIEHRTSSPHYPRSNGLAESAVKSAKRLLRRCWDAHRGRLDQEEWTRGVLQQRNTPGVSGKSPAEIVYSRPLGDDLPIHQSNFDPICQSQPLQQRSDGPRAEAPSRSGASPDDRREVSRRDTKQRYDRHARDLPEFTVGTRVRVQDVRTKRWDTCGIITGVCPYRRYRVRYDNGGEVERNRCHLRRRHALCPVPRPSPDETRESGGTSRPSSGRTAPARLQERSGPVVLRRSTRARKPVRRLIEEM